MYRTSQPYVREQGPMTLINEFTTNHYPSYQIEYESIECGSRVASTKRKVHWRFGFSNSRAIDAGATGLNCRGEEHDVSIVWSVSNGKRSVFLDGESIHVSTKSGGVFEHSWKLNGVRVCRVVCYAHPKKSQKANPNFRQYDLIVDGQSFFNFSRVEQLGMVNRLTYRAPQLGQGQGRGDYDAAAGYTRNWYDREGNSSDLAAAINGRMHEARRKNNEDGHTPYIQESRAREDTRSRNIYGGRVHR
mmetsp:Transcript_15393/g.22669  ORF Transcript_15393/g.22669 Transcript_15393/m.22669 type:complete len:246 (+) Transcript_15393:244-981(+)|eukprot:CAMPEP_0195529986 /NCGR_PEP_ID=MMETSP0794_2-20130614/32677_1 /TAXON_ID=515487 /ORGANISM="Stephanopyxis turris, Strain CCMP 815" /LENGTH=245 /DNA_ID=CAMNT_0040661377 /DNA_START=226 /DNA_END=963 /DNA_ORIENTATION=+